MYVERSNQVKKVTQSDAFISRGVMQRKCDCGQHTQGGGECAVCSNEKLNQPLQAKLEIGKANDKYEQEADMIADKIARMDRKDEQAGQTSEQTVSLPDISRLVQRAIPKSNEVDPFMEFRAEQVVKDVGSGQPMPEGVQQSMENSFGRDFSQVRLHTDHYAQTAVADLNARAFTHQNHIWLGRGENVNDKRIMAHELTHVIQQGAATKQSSKVQRIQRQVTQNETETTADGSRDPRGNELGETLIIVKKGPITSISKSSSAALENIELNEGGLQRKETGVPNIQRADPATVGAAVAVATITYQVVKDLINMEKGDITYTFDRMKGQKYPNNNKNWEKIKNWESTYWDIHIIHYSPIFNEWLAGMEVRLNWEYNGYGLSGIYFTKRDFWDKPFWGGDFTWIIQPLMATRKDVNGNPVAQVKIVVDANFTQTLGSDIPGSKSWIIDGEGRGK